MISTTKPIGHSSEKHNENATHLGLAATLQGQMNTMKAKTAFGKNPRTGYLCPPVKFSKPDTPVYFQDRLSVFAEDIVRQLKKHKVSSYYDVMFNFRSIFGVAPSRFSGYQIHLCYLLVRIYYILH